MNVKVTKVGKNVYEIYNRYYIVVKSNACQSCDLKGLLSGCLLFNVNPYSCADLIGNNKYSRKCFKEYKGGI